MATQIFVPTGSNFKLKRPLITSNGFSAETDATVKDHLAEANDLLGRKIFLGYDDPAAKAATAYKITTGGAHLRQFLKLPFGTRMYSKKHQGEDQWEHNTILHEIYEETPDDKKQSISEIIDVTEGLASLKYDFGSLLSANWNTLSYNIKTVLGYPSVTDYLIAYGFIERGIKDVQGLYSFITRNPLGASNIVRYAVISSSRKLIHEEQHNIPFNSDTDGVIKNILVAAPSLSVASFKPEIERVINDYLFNRDEIELLNKSSVGSIPPGMIPALVRFIQVSPVKITPENIDYFLPNWIMQLSDIAQVVDDTSDTTTQPDQDFEVEFLQDDQAIIQISESNVKCAAQLFYCMVVGDELDVFNVVNFFTHKYLISGNMEIQDRKLRENLQLYVFSNKFPGTTGLRLLDRSQPAERQMFYKQVFNAGNPQVTDDLIVNDEFPRMWKVMMLESAKYLERAQESVNPDSYVSRTNVAQAVEDLQYNLSTHCTGMANVITPLLYQELDFVIRKILMSPEVMRQVVPSGGTWWRVVEALFVQMKRSRPRSTVLYNKAKLGHDIIRSIAEYAAGDFEDDAKFSDFMSSVDSFITTQSILQESLTDDLRRGDNDIRQKSNYSDEEKEPERTDTPEVKGGNDEWNF